MKMFLFPLLFCGTMLYAQSTTLNVRLDNLKTTGNLIIYLYDSAEAFPTKRDKARDVITIPADASTVFCTFKNISPGLFAIAVTHDENANGKMDRNWIGIPNEGYGASNDAKGTFGPPSFDDAKFIFSSPTDTVRIRMRY